MQKNMNYPLIDSIESILHRLTSFSACLALERNFQPHKTWLNYEKMLMLRLLHLFSIINKRRLLFLAKAPERKKMFKKKSKTCGNWKVSASTVWDPNLLYMSLCIHEVVEHLELCVIVWPLVACNQCMLMSDHGQSHYIVYIISCSKKCRARIYHCFVDVVLTTHSYYLLLSAAGMKRQEEGVFFSPSFFCVLFLTISNCVRKKFDCQVDMKNSTIIIIWVWKNVWKTRHRVEQSRN